MAELISGRVTFSQVRPVQVEDLLRREPATIELESIAGFLEGATVMVTGAGGSIGSELCRQIMAFHPGRLLLLGRGENSIYQIHQELLGGKGPRAEEWGPGPGNGASAPSARHPAPGAELARRSPGGPHGAGVYPPPLAAWPTPGGGGQGPAIQRQIRGTTRLVPLIADIRDLPRLKALVREYRPSVIFHAAAHKHVPLMEANPSEAVATNVFGTRNLLEAAAEIGVDGFVLVSTDKAVNPTSIMGATKRVAELLLRQAAARTGRRYVAVRFGNVLGSRGSVVPLFRRQIEAGGPVTVTHREITRYFMTIPEASQLIIQAAAMGRGGEIFVLDMGEPIRIYDLALELIRLSGLEPFRDIDVRVTGLRPGEKLHEELFTPSEARLSTRNSRIFVSSLRGSNGDHLEEGLAELEGLLAMGGADEASIRAALGRIVPEFRPAPAP
jgi:FlaA1/EpsC-like NDP-sugar epimerase